MAASVTANEAFERGKEGCCENECGVRKSVSSSDYLSSELMSSYESSSFQDSASPPSTSEEADNVHVDRKKFQKQEPSLSGAYFSLSLSVCVCVFILL